MGWGKTLEEGLPMARPAVCACGYLGMLKKELGLEATVAIDQVAAVVHATPFGGVRPRAVGLMVQKVKLPEIEANGDFAGETFDMAHQRQLENLAETAFVDIVYHVMVCVLQRPTFMFLSLSTI